MGREVRRVPATWEHPREKNGHYRPLYGRSLTTAQAEWDKSAAAFESDYPKQYIECGGDYSKWDGARPSGDRYMPDWPDSERTHLQMYETCSEGTPISPVFATPEELARWCADNGASAFGSMTASYEAWLRIARGGFAPSMVMTGDVMESGVEAHKDSEVTS